MHIKEHGKVTDKWETFVELLFKDTEPFKSWAEVHNENQPASAKSIRTQFDARISEFKKTFGWEEGKCRNLSDEEGDLSELNSLIKNMLLEQFQYEQEKKVSKADNGEINLCETTVLLNALGEKSKVKRRIKMLTEIL